MLTVQGRGGDNAVVSVQACPPPFHEETPWLSASSNVVAGFFRWYCTVGDGNDPTAPQEYDDSTLDP